jgi:septal ring factor EnvC (AmiA/AmiB activator)
MPEDMRRCEELRCKIDRESANSKRENSEAKMLCERLNQELRERVVQIAQLQAQSAKLQARIDSIEASISWRMTWPIRWLHKQANRTRSALLKLHLH